MSRKHSRPGSMSLGVLLGAMFGCILSFVVGFFTPVGYGIANLFGSYELGAAFFILYAFIPASTFVGAITGALIVAWRMRDRG